MDFVDNTLASETRKEILELLSEKNHRPSDLSRELGKNASTIVEHLEKLSAAGLVERLERKGHKWVFYKLSKNGEAYFPNMRKRALFFAISLTSFIGTIISLFMAMQQYSFEVGSTILTIEKNALISDDMEKIDNIKEKKDKFVQTTAESPQSNLSNIPQSEVLNISQRNLSPQTKKNISHSNIWSISQYNVYLYVAIVLFILFIFILIRALLLKTNVFVFPKK